MNSLNRDGEKNISQKVGESFGKQVPNTEDIKKAMNQQNKTERWVEEFDSKWDSLVQNGGFISSVTSDSHSYKAITDFIYKLLSDARREEGERCLEALPKRSPFIPQHCQNRNGLDYCGTCEQAWEDCSCPARNTGFNQSLTTAEENIKNLE